MLKVRLTLSLLLLFSVAALANAAGWRTLRSCVPMSVPIFPAGSHQYQALKVLSFVNNRFDPIAISKPRNEGDVRKLVKCARAADVTVCARSGGHSFLGASLCPGLVIDLQDMRSVKMMGKSIAEIQTGATMGEILWELHKRKRWYAAGVGPTVGIGGYSLGGGIGPYMGKMGLACDRMISARIVDRKGEIIVASKTKKASFFWGLCGAGGGQFGIVVSVRVQTTSSAIYDKAVIFRFNWKPSSIAELMEKWTRYDEEGGRVWFRMEIHLASTEPGISAYGACYDVDSVAQCMKVLNRGAFFRVPGRTTSHISKVPSALHLHAFFGPDGGWAKYPVSDVRRAMIEKRGTSSGNGVSRSWQSAFLVTNKGGKRMDRGFWQRYGEFCSNPGRYSFPWVICELGLLRNAVGKARNNAFAHRDSDILTHYIIGGGSDEDKKFVNRWMRNYLQPFTTGGYVLYPELELKSTYAKAYWGNSLGKLKKLKRAYDPGLFFFNPQPIPV